MSSWPFGNLIFIVGISFIDLVSSKVIVGTPVKSNKDFIKIYTYVVSNISYWSLLPSEWGFAKTMDKNPNKIDKVTCISIT